MSEENNQSESTEEVETVQPKPKSTSSSSKKKSTKNEELFDVSKVQLENLNRLKKRYAGKEVVLTPRSIMWGVGSLMLNSISEDGISSSGIIPENLPLGEYAKVAAAINQGIISIDPDDIKKYKKYRPELEDLNDEHNIEVYTDIEYALSVDFDKFKEELRKLKAEGHTDEFFESMLAEEQANRKREEYIQEIKDFISK